MSVQKIIQEAINKNPLALKEALEEELRSRVALALEAKVAESDDDDDEDNMDESFDLSDLTLDEASVKSVMGMHQVVHNGKPVATYVAKYEAQDHARQINDEERRNRKKKNESFDLSDYTLEELEDFMMSEDFEQLDEISKDTLRSYARKASQQNSNLRDRNDALATRNLYKGQNKYSTLTHDKKEFDRNTKTINKRSAGISKAIDRLAK